MESPDLSLLEPLDALLQEGSVTGAARRTGRSTPAMSQLLGRLRAQLADPLLVRAGRGMVLTPRAEAMKAWVHTALLQARQALTPVSATPIEQIDRECVVSASDYVLMVLGLTLDRLARDEAPQLRLRFLPNSADDAAALRGGSIELAVGIYGALPPELRQRALLTDRFVCVARKDHPLIGAKLSMERYLLQHHIQIAPRGQPGGYVDDVLAEHGKVRKVRRAVPYFLVALSLVAHTDDLLTVSERVATSMAASHHLRILELPFEIQPYALSLLWHPRFDGDQAHQFLRDAFVRAADTDAGHRHQDPLRRLDDRPKPRKSR